MSDIVLTLQLPATSSSVTYTNAGLDAFWGARAIKQLGIRIGGSSLYYWSGRQLAVECMEQCEDSAKRDQLLLLGGQASVNCASDLSGAVAPRTAYVYIKCPWNTPSQQEKGVPLPTDLLTQPVQLLIELAPMSEVFSPLVPANPITGLPTAYQFGEVCFRQVHMQDSSMLLARRENMNEKAYSLPLKYFSQTQFQAPVPGTAAGNPIQINLTGFRSGQIDDMLLYLVSNDDLASGHGLRFQPMSNVRVLINGLVYYDAKNGSSDIWSLVERKTSASFNIPINNNGTLSAATPSPYVQIPFAQKFDVLTGESSVESGFPIMNSVVNLSFTVPAAATDYTLFAVYRYNSNLLFSKGSCEYVF
jgi:hypothetical protein